MENYIKQYFDNMEGNINLHLNSDINIEELQKLKIRLEIIRELKNNIIWQFKDSERKQSSRIQHLATLRKIDALPQFIRKQELSIEIYDQIKLTLPYLEALNNDLNKTLIFFLIGICDKIDLEGYHYNKNFPADIEIKNEFKIYFEFLKPCQTNGGMFKECYEKIDLLYQNLMQINNS